MKQKKKLVSRPCLLKGCNSYLSGHSNFLTFFLNPLFRPPPLFHSLQLRFLMNVNGVSTLFSKVK